MMHRTRVVLALAAALAAACMPSVNPPTPPSTREADAWPMRTLEDSVYRVAIDWFFATAQHDTIAAARILDDRFMGQDPNGIAVTKPALLHELSAGRYHSLTGDIHDLHVQRVGDVAVVLTRMGWGRSAGSEGGADTAALYRMTEMFVRDGGRWRLASEQSARIMPVHVTVQDSLGAMNALHQLLQAVEDYGRARGTWGAGLPVSAFAATEPHRLDDDDDLSFRMVPIIDVPRWVYFDTTAAPVARIFDPERLRVQMLSPDAAVATFEVARPDTIERRTVVLQRAGGEWRLVHVHASSVAALPKPGPARRACRTVPPPPMQYYPPRPPRVARIPAPRIPRAPNEGSVVVGVVTDATNGLPIGEAQVVLDVFDPAPQVRVPGQTVRTDTLGGFHIEAVGAGRYELRVRGFAHAPVTDTVSVRGGEVDTVRVRLPYFRCTDY